ncbi:S8 family peptidase [Paenibacillus sp. FSL M7-0802]|jgi:type VII secretion-associated serine protease mycosin|uniref:S8 family peptidase n=1 Tax=Paenibacillus polymyxa TaxID=1406 RepID=A0AAP3ZZG2_PAEPO|nr:MULTISPECIES: S8 family peptidase [Paenibacillus]MBP1177301.1 type VII secretion-associated serine protease mycosin [Paenibacillus sp. PvR133]MCP3743611.1 S8 family peptidase [Paenibacillus sp. A3M_27_13]MDH2332348.1 S8 family peptidase [Paenibacillus polymyxa]
MSRRKWLKPLLGAAAGVLLITLMLPSRDHRPTPQPEYTAKMVPQQEKQLKKGMLALDLSATDTLTRMDARQDIQYVMRELDGKTADQKRQFTRTLQQSHSHLHTLLWIHTRDGNTSTYTGSKAQTRLLSHPQINSSLAAARRSVMQNKSYESAAFQAEGGKYFVMAEPSADGTCGVAALVSQQVLRDVEKHQRKNLRLIPYPKEGSYKIESVHPDTLHDITVKTGHDNENASHYFENEIVVRFRHNPDSRQLQEIAADLHCAPGRKLGYTYVFHSDKMNFKELKQYFSRKWNPLYTEPHYMYLTNEKTPIKADSSIPNDLLFSRYQWNLPATETNRGWKLSKGSKDVIVAVVDTGVDLDHPDLKGQILSGHNVVNPSEKPYDDVGHGTHVAGIISALVNNGEGVAGMTWYNKVMPIKVLDQSGSGTTYSVAEGIIWAADHGAKVINLSLGNYAQAEFLHDAIKYAYDKDVVLVAATGNDNTERPGYPAAYPEVFAVSATDSSMHRASFSNYGDYVDVMAPGASIASTYPGNQYAALSGTSMASPHVSALAALIRSINPDLTNKEVMDLMRSSVIDLGTPGHDKYFGYGQIDVYKALKAAQRPYVPLQFYPQHLSDKLKSILKKLET